MKKIKQSRPIGITHQSIVQHVLVGLCRTAGKAVS